MYKHIVDSFVVDAKRGSLSLKDILFKLFENKELKSKYLNEIRRSTIIGQIANDILRELGENDFCKIMAIGDVEYFGELKAEWENIVKSSLIDIDVSNLSGYDLSGQGTLALRNTLFDYMDNYYDLSGLDKQIISDSIIPTYGGTDGFVSIMDMLKIMFSDKNINFVYPEASFMANVKIAESVFGESNLIKLDKPASDDFFFSENQVSELYKNNSLYSSVNIFYITPVGNPTGSKIDEENLVKILENIVSIDSNTIFILDSVYIGILEESNSINMFGNILNNPDLMAHIIFSESLSKTLGTTGLRLGWIWTMNKLYNEELKKNIILKKAGFSKILNEFIVNLLKNKKEITGFQNKVYSFWSSQRLSFMKYITSNYSKFYDFESSPKVAEREGIYVLLKVKEGFRTEDVFAETGIIGVGINLSDGLYIRYAFGNVRYF